MTSVLSAAPAVVLAAGAAVLVAEAVHLLVRRLCRNSVLAADLARTAHKPFLATVTVLAVQQAVRSFAGEFTGRPAVLHGLALLAIAAFAWLVGALLLVLEDGRADGAVFGGPDPAVSGPRR